MYHNNNIIGDAGADPLVQQSGGLPGPQSRSSCFNSLSGTTKSRPPSLRLWVSLNSSPELHTIDWSCVRDSEPSSYVWIFFCLHIWSSCCQSTTADALWILLPVLDPVLSLLAFPTTRLEPFVMELIHLITDVPFILYQSNEVFWFSSQSLVCGLMWKQQSLESVIKCLMTFYSKGQYIKYHIFVVKALYSTLKLCFCLMCLNCFQLASKYAKYFVASMGNLHSWTFWTKCKGKCCNCYLCNEKHAYVSESARSDLALLTGITWVYFCWSLVSLIHTIMRDHWCKLSTGLFIEMPAGNVTRSVLIH